MVEFRRLISFGKTSFVTSIPKSWVTKNHLKKGDLVALDEKEGNLILSPESNFHEKEIEVKDLKINNLGIMTSRYIHALYKKGIDEIDISFDDPKLIEQVQKSLGKEVIGYEIIEQKSTKCVIKNISGGLEGFDQIMRRMFLMLIAMADESLSALENKDFVRMPSIALLEESNNRFTTSCRRILNKNGYKKGKVGPIYYIIEDLENLADEYKYLCYYLHSLKDKNNVKIGKDMIDDFKEVNELLRTFYDMYYKFDNNHVVKIGESRKKLIDKFLKIIETGKNPIERVIAHHLLVITQKLFCFTGPFLVNVL